MCYNSLTGWSRTSITLKHSYLNHHANEERTFNPNRCALFFSLYLWQSLHECFDAQFKIALRHDLLDGAFA
jgi:hypothetical protein